MGIDYEGMKKALEEFPETPAGKAYFKNMAIKHEIKLGRYKKFEKYLETHDFDELMYKLILEHGEEWREKCWHNGYEVHPNNKLAFIIDYVVIGNETFKSEDKEEKSNLTGAFRDVSSARDIKLVGKMLVSVCELNEKSKGFDDRTHAIALTGIFLPENFSQFVKSWQQSLLFFSNK
jgi:hypothetical protein